MIQRNENTQELPLDLVGSNVFGRYGKISKEETFNCIISDGWMVPFAGYSAINPISLNGVGQGRGIFTSTRGGFMITVVDNVVYRLDTNFLMPGVQPVIVGRLLTYVGDVFIDEDIQKNIAICDKTTIWIYNYASGVGTFVQARDSISTALDFMPTYVCYQDGRFIATDSVNAQWRLSDPSTGNIYFPNDFMSSAQHVAQFQTKPDNPLAVFRFPGRGNLLLIMGSVLTEAWTDLGLQLFPYQKSTSYNLDYGCLSAATIATNENYVVWLSANEKSGPAIMYTTGADVQRISTDGIDFKLASVNNPSNSYGFLFRQDGHLIYVITFADPSDNFSYCYDFNTQKFFTLCDPEFNHHPAKRVVFFNESYYFVSFNDGFLYELSTNYTAATTQVMYNSVLTVVTNDIPRIRTCKTIRAANTLPFITDNMTFPMEMGEDPNYTQAGSYAPGVYLNISTDGGAIFGTYGQYPVNYYGLRQNRVQFWQLGWSNEIIPQFRFYGLGRFVFGNGTASVHQ